MRVELWLWRAAWLWRSGRAKFVAAFSNEGYSAPRSGSWQQARNDGTRGSYRSVVFLPHMYQFPRRENQRAQPGLGIHAAKATYLLFSGLPQNIFRNFFCKSLPDSSRTRAIAAILIFGVVGPDGVLALPLSILRNICDRHHFGPSLTHHEPLNKRITE